MKLRLAKQAMICLLTQIIATWKIRYYPFGFDFRSYSHHGSWIHDISKIGNDLL